MRVLVVMAILISTRVAASPNVVAGASPGMLCRAAIAAAEREQAIPAHLMVAIGRVESGRREEATAVQHPWPWTIDAEGQGAFFDTEAQAIKAVEAMRARGVRSIDVGCMQINLMYHPDAFSSLEQAFDPRTNAAYAARFLRALYGRTGDWTKAVALYHSATPALGEPYAKKVMALWPEETKAAVPRGGAISVQHPIGATTLPLVGRTLELYRSRPVGIVPRLQRQRGRF